MDVEEGALLLCFPDARRHFTATAAGVTIATMVVITMAVVSECFAGKSDSNRPLLPEGVPTLKLTSSSVVTTHLGEDKKPGPG